LLPTLRLRLGFAIYFSRNIPKNLCCKTLLTLLDVWYYRKLKIQSEKLKIND